MPNLHPPAPRLRRAALPVLLTLVLALGPWAGTGFAAQAPAAFPDLPLNPNAQQAAALGLGPGKPASLSRIPAQALLVLLVSYFCPPCHKEMPRIKDLERRIRERGLAWRIRLIGLAVGDDQALVASFLARHGGLNFPLLPDPVLAAHKRLGNPVVPTLYAVAGQGGKLRLVLKREGEFVEDPDAFLDILLRALSIPPGATKTPRGK